MIAAGYEGVVIVDLDFWRPFKEIDADLMLGPEECLHLRGCFFITPKERAIALAGGFDALWSHFADILEDAYAWPAPADT
jgi:hypothetical protein